MDYNVHLSLDYNVSHSKEKSTTVYGKYLHNNIGWTHILVQNLIS